MTWDYDKKAYKEQANADPKWHLERLINYGLGREKLNKDDLKKHLKTLKIPEQRRAFLETIV